VVDAWLRTSGAFDGVVDFDRLLRDPDRPGCMLRQDDSGDHLHPSDAGYQAMADAVPLAFFR
jgi:lysophospholipase L1-like esterase